MKSICGAGLVCCGGGMCDAHSPAWLTGRAQNRRAGKKKEEKEKEKEKEKERKRKDYLFRLCRASSIMGTTSYRSPQMP